MNKIKNLEVNYEQENVKKKDGFFYKLKTKAGQIRKNNIEVMPKACPMDGVSKREDMKKLLQDLSLDIPMVRANIYGAIRRNLKEWEKKK